MNTKQKGDIAEQTVVLEALKREWNVLQPMGDHLPYDIVFEINGSFMKIQVKSAWFDKKTGNWVVDNRRSNTNQRSITRSSYATDDFDYAILVIGDLNIFYIMPIEVFNSYGSGICLVESTERQRKPKSHNFREAWGLIEASAS